MRFLKFSGMLLLLALLNSCGSTAGVLAVDEPAHVINADAQSFLTQKKH